MTHLEIREKFLKFFEERGHKIVPSSSLLPTDPSVLFTTAGMQQFKPYYTGEADPMRNFGTLNTVSIQKSMRTSDIDEVGDDSHLTFFEMLGNFSFGGYWKKETIEYAATLLTDRETGMGIDHERVHVTYCADEQAIGGPDVESKAILENNPFFKNKIKPGSKEDNFWGPTGNQGPCGPTVEFYIDGIEVWNLVFNEFYCNQDKTFRPLTIKGVDTGMGLERLAMVVQGKDSIFETDLFTPLMSAIPARLSLRIKRIVADHARATVFLISDGVTPSNKDQGYVLRKLIRRLIIHAYNIGGVGSFSSKEEALSAPPEEILSRVIDEYKKIYKELGKNLVLGVFDEEFAKFQKASRGGMQELQKLDKIDNVKAFYLYESFGLPYEAIKELGEEKAKELTRSGFGEEFKKHQEKSRAGLEKKFGGHGLIMDTGELKAGNEEELKKITRLHTATHLLNQALHNILGEGVGQAGSDITAERTRFDFTFDRKLTPEELKKIEDEVNEKIEQDLPVRMAEVPKSQAIEGGARSFRPEKYPDVVKIYYIGTEDDWRQAYSKEFCGGPHVNRTGEIGHFKITKEESVYAGTRRIRAVVD